MNCGIPGEKLAKIVQIFVQHEEVVSAILYGSRAKGNHKTGSDIDISLQGNISLTLLNRISLELDDLFLPERIDLSVYNEIRNEDLKDHIDTVGKELYHRSTHCA